MPDKRLILLAAAQGLIFSAVAATAAVGPGEKRSYRSEMTAREEIRRSYELSPGATVRVAGIAGPVTIETGSGSGAEVYILREARTQRELDCYRTDVQATRQRLAIEHVQFSSRAGCNSIRSRQEVRLRLPRSVDVDLDTIAGAATIAPIEGDVRLESIAGAASVAGARGADISSIAGPLSLTVTQGSRRVSISSVAGPVDLAFARGVGADVRVDSIVGHVRSLSSDMRVSRTDAGYRARVGSGGSDVSLSSIVGTVRLRRP
jgi:hypothetical protein